MMDCCTLCRPATRSIDLAVGSLPKKDLNNKLPACIIVQTMILIICILYHIRTIQFVICLHNTLQSNISQIYTANMPICSSLTIGVSSSYSGYSSKKFLIKTTILRHQRSDHRHHCHLHIHPRSFC